MRSLWTAASGMTAQQLQVDNISNNIANVNTHGHKRERIEFATLLYDTMQQASLDPANPPGRPVNLQVGMGVRPVATARDFSPGSFERTDGPLDFAIHGPGFFVARYSSLEDPAEINAYTRNGAFVMSPNENGELMLVNNQGFPILDTEGTPIVLPDGNFVSDMQVTDDGQIWLRPAGDPTADPELHDQRIQIVQFQNVQGLESIGDNFFAATTASGAPILESDGEISTPSRLIQGVLEMSNVNIANEMVSLIVSQRAYELNSRAIQASDQMLQEASNLRR